MINKRVIIISVLFFFSGVLIIPKLQAATYSFGSFTVDKNCNVVLPIYADATSQQSNAADLVLKYDPSQVQIVDTDPNQDGIQIEPGDAYESYIYNKIVSDGLIKMGAVTFHQLDSKKVFAYLHFIPNTTATINFTIGFDGVGATKDSNIADKNTNDDILSSVENWSGAFESNYCTQFNVSQPVSETVPPQSNNQQQNLIQLPAGTAVASLALLGILSGILLLAYLLSRAFTIRVMIAGSHYALKYVKVRFYDPQTKALQDVKLTDKKGEIKVPSDYKKMLVHVDEEGFEFPSKIIDKKYVVKEKSLTLMKLPVNGRKNKAEIFIDEVK